MDDAEILAASVEDREAFGQIFERHYDAISRYARRRVGQDAGEELTARTFMIAFERRDRFDPAATSAKPWLYGIATNLIRHHVRDERTHLMARGRLPVQLVEPDPNEDVRRLDARLLSGALGDALLALSAGDRDAFLLNVSAELTYEEVAIALSIPVGTVKSRVHRARRQLRERLSSVAGIEGWTIDLDDDWTDDG